MIETVTQDYPALITVLEETRHGLEVGNQVILSSIVGMSELNGVRAGVVQVKDGYSFTIDVDTRGMGVYRSGGYVTPVKQPINIRLVIYMHNYMFEHASTISCLYIHTVLIYIILMHILYIHVNSTHIHILYTLHIHRFKSLAETVFEPGIFSCDVMKMDTAPILHLAWRYYYY